MWRYNHTDELYHWGIKGQKWGVRRFQNKNGSLTSAGRKRQKRQMSQDAKEASIIKKKKVSEMSNAELRKLNERQNLERNHKSLNPSVISRGAKAVTIAAATLGTIAGLEKNGVHVINSGKRIAKKATESLLRNPTGNRVASKTISILANIKK